MKKHTLLYLVFVGLLMCACKSEVFVYSSFHEPATDGLRFLTSKDGIHWDSIPGTWLTPAVGKQRVMRDPSIQSTPDGTFHLVWTSSWRGDLGFGYASSKDLKHWTKEEFIPVMTDTTTVNVWAPELFWDDTRKEMMVIWASCIPGKFARGIEDEKNNHRLYYTTTKDFKTFAPAQLLIDPGFSSIDATLVKRGERDYVMVLKDNTRPERDLKIATARDPRGPWSAAGPAFTEKLTEGPATVRVKEGWVIYYDRYGNKDFGAVFTKDFKSFEDWSKKVSIPPLHKHGTIFKAKRTIVEGLIHN
jgi:predicted GH43/DUF377 family glycosyl hydrolase